MLVADLTSLGLNRTRGVLPSISLAMRFTPSSPAAADLLQQQSHHECCCKDTQHVGRNSACMAFSGLNGSAFGRHLDGDAILN